MYTAKPIPTLTGKAAERFVRLMEDVNHASKRDMSAAKRLYDTIMAQSL